MSFDIYFLATDRPFAESLDAMEAAAMADERPFEDDDQTRWDRIVADLAELWPDREFAKGPGFRELSDEKRGVQLAMSPGELSLSVAYWHTGAEAETLDAWLRSVVAAVEGASGLVAYDPQSDGAFLDSAPGAAAATMDTVAEHLDMIRRDRSPSPGQSFLRRLFRRR